MKSKEEIVEILKSKFSSVYCDTCASNLTDVRCDECHRKAMNWEISDEFAEQVASEIIKED